MSTSYNTPDDIDDSPVGILLPMGKHAGTPVAEAPLQYLAWAYGAWTFTIYPELQRAIERRLGVQPDPVIRSGPAAAPAAQPPAQTQSVAKVAPSNGHVARPGKPETAVAYMCTMLDRTRREALLEVRDDPDLTEFVETLFARVRAAIGV